MQVASRVSKQNNCNVQNNKFVDPPGPPRDVRAVDVTKTSCVIQWQEPEFDGGKPISGYYVEKLTGSRWIKVRYLPI